MTSPEPICPTCEVPDIPSIINPLTLYSDSYSSASESLSDAISAVDALAAACSPCSGVQKDKLDQARIHKNTAEMYMDACPPGGSGPACRLVNYYASMAKILANEGYNIL
jgi:hypothetical protein